MSDYPTHYVVFGVLPPPATPEVTSVDPAALSEITATTAITFGFTGTNIKRALINVVYGDGATEVIWTGEELTAAFATSTLGDTAITVRRAAGWPDAAITLEVTVFDYTGGSTFAELAYTVSDPVQPPIPDLSPPVVSNVSPAPGQPIFATSATSFDVTDDVGLRRVSIYDYHAGYTEVVFDGVAFQGPYVGSRQTAISNGYRFQIMRRGGWIEAPKLAVYPTDTSGNEVT